MSLALVRKEVREHAWVMSAVLLLDVCALAIMLNTADEAGGRFIALTRFTASMGLVSALVLAGRLFVREYSGKTQLFLEVLPIGRGRIFATKWLLGAGWTLGLTGLAWAVTLWWQRRTEVITTHDAALALAATASYALATWAFSAMAGLLGRYRALAWFALLLFLLALSEVAELDLKELPFFALVSASSATARAGLPLSSLLHAAAITSGCLAVAMALTLSGTGAIAATLSQRMTPRERAFVAGAVLVGFFGVFTLKKTPEKPPFKLADAVSTRAVHALIGVMTTEGFDEPRARALGGRIGADVDSLVDALGLDIRPSIFVLPQHGLDRELVQHAALGEAKGIVLRVAPDVAEPLLRASVLHALLFEATNQRAQKEDRHALLDGLTDWWALRGDPAGLELEWARAAAAPPITAALLENWDTTGERLGPCLENAVAFAAVATLFDHLGELRALALFKQLFARPRGDVRVLFERSPAKRLADAGLSWTELAQLTEAARRSAAQRAARRLAQRPVITASVTPSLSAERGRTLEAQLDGAPSWSAHAAKLLPWAAYAGTGQRLDVTGPRATLPLTLAAGDEVWAALEVSDAALECTVRVYSQRLEVP